MIEHVIMGGAARRTSAAIGCCAAFVASILLACGGDETAAPPSGTTSSATGAAGAGGNGASAGSGLVGLGGAGGNGASAGSGGASCEPFSPVGKQWNLRAIDDIGGAPIYPDLTFGPSGQPWVAFRKGTASERYAAVARLEAGGWTAADTVELVAGRYLGKRPSIAVEADGTLDVVAYDEDDWRPRLSRKPPGGAWTTEALHEPGIDSGDHSSLALGPDGTLHVAFTVYGDYEIVHGSRVADQWSYETVSDANGPVTGGSSSLAVTSDGLPELAIYTGQPDDHLVHAVGPGPTWGVALVDEEAGAGHYPSLVVQADGSPAVGYLRWLDGDAEVRVARLQGSSWRRDVVDEGLGISYTTGLAALPCAGLAVAYARNEGTGTGGLWLAYQNPGEADWTRVSVDSTSYVSGIDLGIDPAGRIHLVYLDETSFVLRHAVLE